jgi:ATP-dependent helicase/DNAse subunit B
LLEGGIRGCLAPNCFTFSQFADAVIRAALVPIRPLSRFEKQQLLRRLLDEAAADGRLRYFSQIAETDGLVDQISELFSDLKRQEIWPDEFDRACKKLENAEKHLELAHLYERYQQLLREHQLYDEEGRFWSARDLLAQGRIGPFASVELVVIDGFADFTRTQHEIIALLNDRVKEMSISLPWESGREELFHKSTLTLSELDHRLPGLRRNVIERPRSIEATAESSLAQVERQLFGDPRRIQPRDADDSLQILTAAGRVGEIELLARHIKRLLLDGDAGAGRTSVRPEDIAIVFRSSDETAPLIREVFREYGLPAALDDRVKLSRSPLLGALLAVLKLDLEDWPFRRLLDLVWSNYFSPRWPQWRSGAAAIEADTAIRALQIPKGSRALRAALAGWATAEIDDDAPEARSAAQKSARTALELFGRLASELDRLPTSATPAEWSSALEGFAEDLGMLAVARRACEVPVARQDCAAWDILLKRLSASMEFDFELDGAHSKLDRRQLVERLEQICRIDELPSEEDDVGRVRVISAAAVRSLDVPYLFVAGLSERSFPAVGREDRVYSAAEHRELNGQGLRFVERRERACEEMLLFYEVITRATRRLTLSYSAHDEKAEPLSASPYVAEIERLFRPGTIVRHDLPNLSPIPSETDPYGPRDLRVKAVAMALAGDIRLAGSLMRRSDQRDSAAALVCALRATGERASGDGFGLYEGVLPGDAAGQWLAARYGPAHCWSTSQLEDYAHCPHQFFLKRVLGLRVIEDLSLEIDHFLRGRRVHSLLTDVHRRLNASGQPCSPSTCASDQFDLLVAETLAEVMRRSGHTGAAGVEAAFDAIDHRLIARWIKDYLNQYAQYEESFNDLDSPPIPTHFEVSFGPVEGEDAKANDQLSKREAYELRCNGMTIRLSGRVDRIDVGLVEGQVVFNVLDYKTNPSDRYRLADIHNFKALQLPLYAMAVQDLLLADQNAIPWQAGYWHVRDGGFHPKRALAFHERTDEGIRRTEQWSEFRARLMERVTSLVAGIQQGQFPMHCDDDKCTALCDYKTVCRVHTVRSLEKQWRPPSTSQR